MTTTLHGWHPIAVTPQEGEWLVDWARLDNPSFTDPFWHDTVATHIVHPFNHAFRQRTTLDAIDDILTATPARPTGLIFHMSRCGSTLVKHQLSTLPNSRVLAEPEPIDAVLSTTRRDPRVTEDQRVRWLRSIVNALGQTTNGSLQHYVLKVDAWQTADMPIFERAFPDVPWVFLYRNPIDVLVSHAKEQSWMMSAANAPGTLGIGPVEAMETPRSELHARILAKLCSEAITYGARGVFINYEELPTATYARIAPHFGIELTADAQLAMHAATAFASKRPTIRFKADSDAKRLAATDDIRRASDLWLSPIYDTLETLRSRA